MNETAQTSSTTESGSTTKTNKTSKTKTNIKDECNGRTIYIPDDVLDEMEGTYFGSQLKPRQAGQNEFKKNRHFFSLLLHFGAEALSEADTEEIQARLSKLDEE